MSDQTCSVVALCYYGNPLVNQNQTPHGPNSKLTNQDSLIHSRPCAVHPDWTVLFLWYRLWTKLNLKSLNEETMFFTKTQYFPLISVWFRVSCSCWSVFSAVSFLDHSLKTLHVVSSLVPLTPTPALTDWLSPVVLMIGQILHILAVLTCTNILTLLFSNLTVGQRPKPSALPVLPRFTSSLTSLVLMSVIPSVSEGQLPSPEALSRPLSCTS